MSEKPSPNIHIEYRDPIELKALGKAFCFLAEEFSLFIENNKECKEYRQYKPVLSVKKVGKGSISIWLYVNFVCNMSVNIDVNTTLLIPFILSISGNLYTQRMRNFLKELVDRIEELTIGDECLNRGKIREILSTSKPVHSKKVKLQKLTERDGKYKGIIRTFHNRPKEVIIPESLLLKVKPNEELIVDVKIEFLEGKPISYELTKIYP